MIKNKFFSLISSFEQGLPELFNNLMPSGREDIPWSLMAQMCKAAGLGDEPRRVFAGLSKIRVVDVVLPTRKNVDIRRRCVSKPNEHRAILLQRLGLNLPKNLPCSEKFLKKM